MPVGLRKPSPPPEPNPLVVLEGARRLVRDWRIEADVLEDPAVGNPSRGEAAALRRAANALERIVYVRNEREF